MVRRYNRKYPRNNRKRNYKKKRGGKKKYNKASISTARNGTPFPDRMRVKMRYTSLVNLTSSGGTTKVYRGNSVYDPDYSGTGTTVEGYGLWAAMYNKYIVRAAKIQVRILSASDTVANAACQFTLYPSPNTGAQTNAEAPGEAYAKSVLIGPADGQGIKMLSNYMSTKKILGLTYLDTTDNASAINGDPSGQWFWIIDARPLDGSSALSHYIQVRMTFYVEWFERLQTSQV